ncbi:MAG: CDGSH iron-sulfur domain-containing protein [Candidatus Eisenbacteria bacterium]|uniref:CDGSH iron-sulfur domain-containing protein n=1 Tax=Eiseniibacteriota bacterium TaxID=2212470 RepID=A0A849SLU8_UNCEI|nr:CDGSH iron-sulfur domain-containing protein [Candidatus Eisenbacteria bacterium]
MPTTRVTVMNNGSLRIEGDFEIADQDGQVYGLAGRTRVSLCRCGQSADKPFCDGAHKRCGFESVPIVRDLPPPAPKPAV